MKITNGSLLLHPTSGARELIHPPLCDGAFPVQVEQNSELSVDHQTDGVDSQQLTRLAGRHMLVGGDPGFRSGNFLVLVFCAFATIGIWKKFTKTTHNL